MRRVARRVARRVWGATAALYVLACTDPTVVQDAPGRYALVSVNGKPLPALADTSAVDFGIIIADTVTLDGHGGATRAFVFRRVSTALGLDNVYHPRFDNEYRRGPDNRIEIGSFTPCPSNANCIGNDEGTVTPDGLELTSRRYAYNPHLVFERIAATP